MKTITWTKLYTRIRYEGWEIEPAIISFGKRTTMWRSEDRGNGMSESVPAINAYHLVINLWLVRFNFVWTRDTGIFGNEICKIHGTKNPLSKGWYGRKYECSKCLEEGNFQG